MVHALPLGVMACAPYDQRSSQLVHNHRMYMALPVILRVLITALAAT